MKIITTPIPGFGRYVLDIITQEILNKAGNKMKTRVDDRPGRGQTVVTLTKDNGNYTTVNYHKLVRITLENQSFTPRTDAIMPRVVIAYYNNLTPEFKALTLQEVSIIIADELGDVERLQIGNILNKIHNNA